MDITCLLLHLVTYLWVPERENKIVSQVKLVACSTPVD